MPLIGSPVDWTQPGKISEFEVIGIETAQTEKQRGKGSGKEKKQDI